MRIWFSIDGENYRSEAEKSEWPIVAGSPAAETVLVSIPLQSRIGQFVKVEFSLAAKWLLLSEITFYTGKCLDNSHIRVQEYKKKERVGRELIMLC